MPRPVAVIRAYNLEWETQLNHCFKFIKSLIIIQSYFFDGSKGQKYLITRPTFVSKIRGDLCQFHNEV